MKRIVSVKDNILVLNYSIILKKTAILFRTLWSVNDRNSDSLSKKRHLVANIAWKEIGIARKTEVMA